MASSAANFFLLDEAPNQSHDIESSEVNRDRLNNNSRNSVKDSQLTGGTNTESSKNSVGSVGASISSDRQTSNGFQKNHHVLNSQQPHRAQPHSAEHQPLSRAGDHASNKFNHNNNNTSFVNNNKSDSRKDEINYQLAGSTTTVVKQQQQQQQPQHQVVNMPKSNEPIKLVYPLTSSSNPQQQHIHQFQPPPQSQHHPISNHPQTTIVTTMNSSNQTTGNRVTFASHLPNGTLNITSQPQQIMHNTVSGGIPTNATTIKTITSGGGGGQMGGQQQQQQQQQQQHQAQNQGVGGGQPGTTTQTLGNQQNIVGTPTMIPASVQIVGMRPGTPTQNQQKSVTSLSPRVVIGGSHMVGTRPTSPAITLSALQNLQSGQSGPALILKTENGQYQLLRVSPASSAPVAQNISNAGNQTIRLQTVPAQQPIATSGTSIVVNSVTSTNTTQVLATQTNSTIQHHQQPTIASVAPVPALTQTTHHHQQQQQHHQSQQQQQHQQQIHHQQQQHQQQQQQQQQHQQQQQQQQQQQAQQNAVTVTSGTTTQTQNASTQGNTKEKCRKFLANLIELSSREPKPVERNVRTLIQELIDAHVEPEEFCDRLERLLNASPQPCLIGFLKKSLPLLRQSLFAKELVIEGIKPPPQHVVGIIGSTTLATQLPKIQAQIRPIGQQTTTIGQTQVRMVAQTAPRPIGQTTITKQIPSGVRIQGPIQTTTGVTTGPRLMNAQIRPIGITQSSTAATLVQQNSNIQSPPALQPVSGSQTVFTPSQNVVQIRTSSAVNRSPATVQIRGGSAPVVRATAPNAKNSMSVANAAAAAAAAAASASPLTQVKVGQTQIKQIPAPPNHPHANAGNSTVTVPVNNVTAINSNANAITNASTHKVVTIKAQSAQQQSSKASAKDKEKKTAAAATAAASFFQQSTISMSSSMYGDDDINDVAAMGGVNLAEESQRILGSTEKIGTEIRSCKDEVFLNLPALQSRIRAIVAEKGLDEPNPEVAVLISHACQERLKNIVEKLAVIAEHRIDIIKIDPRYEITKDVRGQIKFLEELDKAEQKRHEEQEREMLLRAAKSRSKVEDPEQAKLKAKAKEMQRAEMEELRQRDANMTALQAIGPRKKPKLEGDATASTIQTGTPGIGTSGISTAPMRPRIKRVNLRDMLFFMEQERETCRSTMLYKAYLK